MNIEDVDYWSLPKIDDMIISCEPTQDWKQKTPVRVVYNFSYTGVKDLALKTIMVRRTIIVDGTGSYNLALQMVLKHFNAGVILGIYVHDKLVNPELLNHRF